MKTRHTRFPAVLGAVLAAASWGATARAQGTEAATPADVAFKEAMALRSAGHDVEACPKFAEVKRLAPAIGVTLYLADCYEKTGRTASAWKEFREGEKMARDRGDKRADTAAQRAAALEPKLNRLTLKTPAGSPPAGAAIQLDGSAVPPDYWNAALAVDPGDHVVTVAAPGRPSRTIPVHVDAGGGSTIVAVDVGGGAEAAPAAAAAAAPPAALAATPAETAPVSDHGAAGRWVGGGLIVAGAVGVALGAWLVTSKTRDMENGQLCDPHLRKGAVPGAIVAFSAGGAAIISGAVLYYVNRPGRSELAIGPSVVPGGAGAFLRGRF